MSEKNKKKISKVKNKSLYGGFLGFLKKKEKENEKVDTEYEKKILSVTSFAQVIDSRPESRVNSYFKDTATEANVVQYLNDPATEKIVNSSIKPATEANVIQSLNDPAKESNVVQSLNDPAKESNVVQSLNDTATEKNAKPYFIDWNRLELNYYLQNLHNYLGKYCFLYGAFVIEDDDKSLYNFLLPYNSRSIPRVTHGSFTSHAFMKDMDISLLITCKGCYGPDGKVFVQNCKWYPFTQRDGLRNIKNYIYLKFERNSSYTLIHWYEAYKRYALKISKENRCPPRREDCNKKDPLICTEEDDRIGRSKRPCNPEACRIKDGDDNHNFKTYSINGGEIFNIQERYRRHGDEMFIPFGVSKFFLEKKSKQINFIHSGDNVDIKVDDDKDIHTIKLITPTEIQDITIEEEDTKEQDNVIMTENPIKGGRGITRKRRKRKTNKRKRKSKRKLFSNIQARHIVK